MTDFFKSLKLHTLNLVRQNSQNQRPKVVLGFSGGPDSAFLLHILHMLQQEGIITLVAAHLDHGWRNESVKDVEFCSIFCKKLGIKFVTQHANQLDLNIKFNGSQEEVGRLMRRHFFKKVFSTNFSFCVHLLDLHQNHFCS